MYVTDNRELSSFNPIFTELNAHKHILTPKLPIIGIAVGLCTYVHIC